MGVAGSSTTYKVIDAQNPTGYAKAVEENSSPAAAPERSYIFGHEVIGQGVGTAVQYLLKDGHGSTRGLWDHGGFIVQTYDSDAFGNPINYSAATAGTIWLQPDGFHDRPSGLTNHWNRYVQPQTGGFFSMDSYEGRRHEPLTLHKYLYGEGAPLWLIDPSGQMGTLSDLNAAMGILAFIAFEIVAPQLFWLGVAGMVVSAATYAATAPYADMERAGYWPSTGAAERMEVAGDAFAFFAVMSWGAGEISSLQLSRYGRSGADRDKQQGLQQWSKWLRQRFDVGKHKTVATYSVEKESGRRWFSGFARSGKDVPDLVANGWTPSPKVRRFSWPQGFGDDHADNKALEEIASKLPPGFSGTVRLHIDHHEDLGPCKQACQKVVEEFRQMYPKAVLIVTDNNGQIH